MLVISRQLLEAVDYLLAVRDPWWWANRDTAYTRCSLRLVLLLHQQFPEVDKSQ
jgi:hypothetical protein